MPKEKSFKTKDDYVFDIIRSGYDFSFANAKERIYDLMDLIDIQLSEDDKEIIYLRILAEEVASSKQKTILRYRMPSISVILSGVCVSAIFLLLFISLGSKDSITNLPSIDGRHPVFLKKSIKKIEAWLSYSCPHCADAWTFIEEIQASEELGKPKVEIRILSSSNKTDMTLNLYRTAIAMQSDVLANKFSAWVFKNRSRILAHGLSEGDLDWLKSEKEFDYEVFVEHMQSPEVENEIKETIAAYHAQKIQGTPALIVNGRLLRGSEISFDAVIDALTGNSPKGN